MKNQNNSIQCLTNRAQISFTRVTLTSASGLKKDFKIDRAFMSAPHTQEEIAKEVRKMCSGRAAQKTLVEFLKS